MKCTTSTRRTSMIGKVKKVLITVILTVLIWVWADLSGDGILNNKLATLRISPGLSKDTLVSLNGGESVEIYLDIKGPSSRIEELRRDNEPLEIFFSPPENMDKQEYQYPLMSLLERYDKLNKLGLTVENCRPATVEVQQEKLVTKQLKVICIDEHNLIVDSVNIEPPFVDMPVRDFWSGDRLTAYVKLSPGQIAQLGTKPVTATPYVEIDPQRFIYSDKPVKITGSDETAAKTAYALSGPRIGFIYNQYIADRYDIKIVEKSDSLNTLQFLATEDAFETYKKAPYHILIEVQEADIKPDAEGNPAPVTKEVIYNFPTQAVRQNKIEPLRDKEWPKVTFQLKPKE
jgi:hypothetical protein